MHTDKKYIFSLCLLPFTAAKWAHRHNQAPRVNKIGQNTMLQTIYQMYKDKSIQNWTCIVREEGIIICVLAFKFIHQVELKDVSVNLLRAESEHAEKEGS